MSAHTAGRLTLGRFGSAHGGPFIEYVNGSAQEQVFSTVPMQSDDHIENARRLAACWNACEGMTTEAVEALHDIGTVGDLGGERDQLRAELAAARALLGEVNALDDANNIATTSTGEGITTRDFDRLVAKIDALLKGGAL